MTNKLQMAVCLHTERRWVMTGQSGRRLGCMLALLIKSFDA